jgi:hypothetical protein
MEPDAADARQTLGVDPVQARLTAVAPLAAAICRSLREQVARLGFDPAEVRIGDALAAVYRLEPDPASGSESLIGEWRDRHGQRVGNLVFHADGSFFVEHDVVRTHPADPGQFVEAVNAWGRGQRILAEPRLLPMVS